MHRICTIEIINKLTRNRKSIDVYSRRTGIVDIIGLNQSITLALETNRAQCRPDYLLIGITGGSSKEYDLLIDLPAWVKFELLPAKRYRRPLTRKKKRLIYKIPPGSPPWKLKIWIQGNHKYTADHITFFDG